MKLKITKNFDFAHRGCDVVSYKAGEEIDATDQELIDVALREKWATKARGAAPENKALSGAGENKAPDGEDGGSDAAGGEQGGQADGEQTAFPPLA